MTPLERAVIQELSPRGYVRAASWTFTSPWSNDEVAHFVRVKVYGYGSARRAQHYASFECGFRNRNVDVFALEMLEKYGGQGYSGIFDEHASSPVWYAAIVYILDDLVRHKPFQIEVYKMEIPEAARAIGEAIDQRTPQILKNITNLTVLLEVLTSTDPLFRPTNGAMRAAQIAYLSAQLGRDEMETRSKLLSLEPLISGNLTGRMNWSEEVKEEALQSYVSNVLREAYSRWPMRSS